MTSFLALDIGGKRTGIAYGNDRPEIVFAMDTVTHLSARELIAAVKAIAKTKNVERLVIGLPRLPGGDEGSQAKKVRAIAEAMEKEIALPVEFLDERFTSLQNDGMPSDPDARSACALAQVVIERAKKII